jgi:hypothetical protein
VCAPASKLGKDMNVIDKKKATHYLWGNNCDILKGTATFYFDNIRIVVEDQKGLLIEPETKHYISNETNDRLDFLVISQPTTNCDRIILE